MDKVSPLVLVAAGGAVLALVWFSTRNSADIGRSIGGGAVDLVGGILRGAWDALPEFGPEPSDYEGARQQTQQIVSDPERNPFDWAFSL